MNQELKQIQQKQEERIITKAEVIAAAKRVRRSPIQESRNIWLVGSGNSKTPNKFYRVIFDEELGEFMCDCKAFEFGTTVPCCHILAAAIAEGSDELEK